MHIFYSFLTKWRNIQYCFHISFFSCVIWKEKGKGIWPDTPNVWQVFCRDYNARLFQTSKKKAPLKLIFITNLYKTTLTELSTMHFIQVDLNLRLHRKHHVPVQEYNTKALNTFYIIWNTIMSLISFMEFWHTILITDIRVCMCAYIDIWHTHTHTKELPRKKILMTRDKRMLNALNLFNWN